MGRAEGLHEKRLMTASEIACHLLECCEYLVHFESYMFGSTLSGIGQDIDILVVGPGGGALYQLKKEMKLAGVDLPLHILYMQPSEVRHTNFVVKEKCVPLVKLALLARS